MPDPIFKEITQLEGGLVGLQAIQTEYQHSFRSDLVLKSLKPDKLAGTLFWYFRIFNSLEFKSENDKSDKERFNLAEIRARLLLNAKIGATYENTLNIIVCSREPKKLLNYIRQRGYEVVPIEGQPWLLQCKVGLVDVMMVICHKMPLEKIYYPWLIFMPANNAKWQKLVERLLDEGQSKLLLALYRMRAKEFEMIEISNERWEELIEQMSPKQKAKYEADRAIATRLFIQKMRRRGRSEIIAEMVSDFAPEERVAGLKPEERVAGLKPEEREALRKLLDEQKD